MTTESVRSMARTLILPLIVGLLSALATLMLLTAQAQAQAQHAPDAGLTTYVPTPEPSGPADDMALVEAALRGIRASDLGWSAKVGLVLVALMALLRRYAKRIPWGVGAFFDTSEGGAVLLMLLTTGGALGSALAVGGSFDWRLIESTVKLGVLTGGGWEMVLKPIWLRVGAPLWSRIVAKMTPAVAP